MCLLHSPLQRSYLKRKINILLNISLFLSLRGGFLATTETVTRALQFFKIYYHWKHIKQCSGNLSL